ncbi:synaptotagmin-2-like [Dioscorea cayenensis subsp. rotundata]|uniref:Synaptotagmin-2-like n=1 Tax=Dioscorea cayennensis subsp. rotundata TaxID=55577 RepID=A0AB40BT16_DIOCR|nr:synaptotagmin-2-like [Dioscorea cayenensis subsp. rotundata]
MMEKMKEGRKGLGDDIEDVEESLLEKLSQLLDLLEKLYDFLDDAKSVMLRHWVLTMALPMALIILYCCYCRCNKKKNKKKKKKEKAVERDYNSESDDHRTECCLDLHSWDFKVSWW